MGAVVQDAIESWENGVVTSGEKDMIPSSASPRAWNSILASVAPGKAIFAKRDGFAVMNRTPLAASLPIIGMFPFRERTGSSYVQSLLLATSGGQLSSMATDGALTEIGSAVFTTGTYYPFFTVMNNTCFMGNGIEAVAFSGGAVRKWGIIRPTVGAMSGSAGAAGSPSGTYELRVTFGNSTTGHESSASDTAGSTVTVSSQKIAVSNIPISPDPQVDRRFLYVRNTATQARFYRAGTLSDNVTTGLSLDFVDVNLTVPAPTTTSSAPPPSTIIAAAVYKDRLFVATPTALYYSPIAKPEAFDLDVNYEAVNADDGQKIVGLASAGANLLILKEHSIHALTGDTPATWSIQEVDSRCGCVAQRSIVQAGGSIFWWSQALGPVMWTGQAVQSIGIDLLAPTIGEEGVNQNSLSTICASADELNQRVLFAVPGAGYSRNTILLPYNTRLQRWESDKWDPMDVSAMTIADDENGVQRLYLGSYAGQVFEYGTASSDGIYTGTHTGTFTAGGSVVTTISDASATFDTTGGGLVHRKVTILDSGLDHITTVRPYVASNTGTSLELSVGVSGLVPGNVYTYIVGGPDFQMDTYARTHGAPFSKKRYEFEYIATRPAGSAILVNLLVNGRDGETQVVQGSVDAAKWDEATWDVSYWAGVESVFNKFRVGKTGAMIQMRVKNPYVDQGLAVVKVGGRAEMQVDKWT